MWSLIWILLQAFLDESNFVITIVEFINQTVRVNLAMYDVSSNSILVSSERWSTCEELIRDDATSPNIS